MWRRYLILITIVIFLIILQTSFSTSWAWQGKFNIILLFTIIAVIFGSFNYAMFWVIFCGYFLDLFSHLNFGLVSYSLLVTVSLVYLISKNFTTHQNWWSLSLLIALGTVFYNVFLSSISFLIWKLHFSDINLGIDFIGIIWQLVINIGLIIGVYYFRNILKKYLIIYEAR